jgi:8-oxo-dGTP pyrophosphatase MutT (NUDIX family)
MIETSTVEKRQAAAVPYRYDEAGKPEVLLVTSRRQKRWILPKGDVSRGMHGHLAAANEAFEEGGVLGQIDHEPVAQYTQRKRLPTGSPITLTILAYPLYVNTELRTWPETAVRTRKWMPVSQALNAVNDDQISGVLTALILRLAAQQPLR